MAKEKITANFLRKITQPKTGSVLIRDTEQIGFCLRITKAGVKSFVFSYSANGKERRMTIGRHPEWSVPRARERAKHLRQQVDLGHDPLEERNFSRHAETVGDLHKIYEEEHLPTLAPRSQKDQASMWTRHILPELGRIKLEDLTARDVDQLHRKISETGTVRANRVLEVLRKALNLAKRWQLVSENVAEGFKRNPEFPKDRYLTLEEIKRLTSAMDEDQDQHIMNAVRILVLTGARKSEVLTARYDQFDLDAGIWKKPASQTKQRRDHVVPLTEPAIELIAGMRAEAASEFLFPTKNGTPKKDIKRPSKRVTERAGLEGIRLHDLRHSFASLLASNDAPLQVVSKLLGHSNLQTTQRYAHLYDSALRAALKNASEALATA